MVWLLMRQRTVILGMIRDKKTRVSDRGFFCGGSAVLPAGLSVRDPVDEFRNGYGASEYFRAADRYLRLYHDEDASRPAAGDFHRPGSVRRLSACYGRKTGEIWSCLCRAFYGGLAAAVGAACYSLLSRAPVERWGSIPVTGMGPVCRRNHFFCGDPGLVYSRKDLMRGAFVLMLLIILVGTVGSLFLCFCRESVW